MNAIEPYLIKVALRILLVISNWAFRHKELTPMICLSDHQTIASQSAIGQCPKQPSLRPCLHGVGDPGLVGLVSFVFTLWGTQNKRNLPH